MKLAKDKHHIHCTSVGSEAALALMKDFFSDGWNEPVEQDPGKYWKGDSPIIGAIRLFTLVFVQSYDDRIAKILWQLALLPATDKKIVKLDMEHRSPMLPDFWWDAINSCCFATLELIYGFSQLFKGG